MDLDPVCTSLIAVKGMKGIKNPKLGFTLAMTSHLGECRVGQGRGSQGGGGRAAMRSSTLCGDSGGGRNGRHHPIPEDCYGEQKA